MQFIIMNYCHCHQSAIIVIKNAIIVIKNAIIVIRMLSSLSSKCYHRYHQNAIIAIKMLSPLSSKCYHRYHQNAITVIIKMLSPLSSECYHRYQELLSSSMELVPSSSGIAIIVNRGDVVFFRNCYHRQ